MSYRCGIGLGMAKFGFTPGPPVIICDNCGREHAVCGSNSYLPYKWFLNNKAPKGWKTEKTADGLGRVDWCTKCKVKPLSNRIGCKEHG